MCHRDRVSIPAKRRSNRRFIDVEGNFRACIANDQISRAGNPAIANPAEWAIITAGLAVAVAIAIGKWSSRARVVEQNHSGNPPQPGLLA